MKAPPGRAPDADAPLDTNAPEGWPRVAARLSPLPGENAAGFVERLVQDVATSLSRGGVDVVDVRRDVNVGAQVVTVDIVVRRDSEEVPVFVFPGLAPEREGAMFAFLRAALEEAEAFEARPVYYAGKDLRFVAEPTAGSIGERAERFLARARSASVPLAWGSGVESVVRAVRQLAAAPIERGGGDTVMEAASFVGEWLRRSTGGRWVLRTDLPRSVLLVQDAASSTQWHLPLFAWFPDAVRMGYDGLATLLDEVLAEAARPEGSVSSDVPVTLPAYREEAVSWLLDALPDLLDGAEAAALLRRCASCGAMTRVEIGFEDEAATLERGVARALAVPGLPPAPCGACGGLDFREAVLVYAFPLEGAPVVVVAEVMESHVRISTRQVS